MTPRKWYPEDPDGEIRPLWHYMFVRPWKNWIFVLTLWAWIALMWTDVLPQWWGAVSVVAWGYVIVSCYRFFYQWRDHKDREAKMRWRHETIMVKIGREEQKLVERYKNAPWN